MQTQKDTATNVYRFMDSFVEIADDIATADHV